MTNQNSQPNNLSKQSIGKESLAKEENVFKAVASKKQKVMKHSIFTLSVILLLLLGAIQPTVTTITKILTEIKEKKELYDDLKEKTDTITRLKREFNGTSAESKNIRKQFKDLSLIYPSRGDFSLVMLNTHEVVTENGFELSSINFEQLSTEDKQTSTTELQVLETWGTNLSIKGPKADLIILLEELENLPMYPEITSVSFANQMDEDGNTSFSISMKIYKVNDPQFYFINN